MRRPSVRRVPGLPQERVARWRCLPARCVLRQTGDSRLRDYSDRPSKGMACIAGFAEIGETIEECVHREVFEETFGPRG